MFSHALFLSPLSSSISFPRGYRSLPLHLPTPDLEENRFLAWDEEALVVRLSWCFWSNNNAWENMCERKHIRVNRLQGAFSVNVHDPWDTLRNDVAERGKRRVKKKPSPSGRRRILIVRELETRSRKGRGLSLSFMQTSKSNVFLQSKAFWIPL